MFVYSDPEKDIRHVKTTHGSYEWWYFDIYDDVSDTGVVVILYDGLLFSPDYHRAQEMSDSALPEEYPGISISVYKSNRTVFYALNGYSKHDVEFGDEEYPVRMGNNYVRRISSDKALIYEVVLDEEHPSGLRVSGTLRFESNRIADRFPGYGILDQAHHWNLIQPKASVSGPFQINFKEESKFDINIEGLGYHDHNIGYQPLEKDFNEWYWGRVHFADRTLVWYIMDHVTGQDRRAWVIFDDESRKTTELIVKQPSWSKQTRFGLRLDDVLNFTGDNERYLIEMGEILDNGPFYLRYKVEAHYNVNLKDEHAIGIAEFIKPDRIQAGWVRPLIKMRYHHHGKPAGWIQKSSLLSPFTW